MNLEAKQESPVALMERGYLSGSPMKINLILTSLKSTQQLFSFLEVT